MEDEVSHAPNPTSSKPTFLFSVSSQQSDATILVKSIVRVHTIVTGRLLLTDEPRDILSCIIYFL